MAKKWRNRAILAKIETTPGTDATPTGAANAMLMVNVSLEPLLGNDLSRDLVLPYMGHQGIILDGNYARLTGEVEIAGAGAAGTAPAYGPLLRACGLAEVVTADTDVVYSPVSSGQETVTIHFNNDGVNQALVYARGTVTMDVKPGAIPRFRFVFTGLIGTIADVALPAVDVTDFIKPVPVNKANTTLSLHGASRIAEGITFDLGGQVEPRFLIGAEAVEIVDRQMTGSAILEMVSLATKNWLATAQAHTTGVLALVHGVTAGHIVQFDAPKVQIGRPTYGEKQRILNNTLPLMFLPDTGNDEFTITVK
ncbi:hypothetical protein CXZ10_05840 [Pleomorphomonas diazotrophica]|uniref:Uncharacterized protein n=1 Tax=Pleomorphomonas diazotrophica TaxID=1166257 RepID=A0A1I4Q9A2_9HYPH|nr:phage tail tube protein [Pleomorphomonas diazotrophica]PKR90870.1 hypothetical protein CXZ10_05840 [Pleomorphomonas diazotrophica]SFM36255.1 hypothetical protein SAMN05192571_101144 [Pleomorphomonas diazotrophica]